MHSWVFLNVYGMGFNAIATTRRKFYDYKKQQQQ